MAINTANSLADELSTPIFHSLIFVILGFVFHYTLKSHLGEYASAIPIALGTLIYVWKGEYLRPTAIDLRKSAKLTQSSISELKRSVEQTSKMKHMGAGEVIEFDAEGRKISTVSSGILKKRSNKKGKEEDDAMKDATTVELKNGRLVNSTTSHLTSAMDWHENEIVPPHRRTHTKRLYTGRRKKRKPAATVAS